MSKLTVVADIHAKSDKVELVKAELLKLIPTTLSEAGCLQYELHQDNDNPAHFLFYENWESRELWQEHIHASHVAAFAEATKGAVEGVTISEMTVVD